jgi:hypothetical protein
MGLNHSDINLSDEQLEQLNSHLSKVNFKSAIEGEDPPGSIKVVFEWVPGLGRSVTVYFDGEINGCEVESY